jgi:hypothetical protein
MPLLVAVQNGHDRVVQLLLAAGANAEAPNKVAHPLLLPTLLCFDLPRWTRVDRLRTRGIERPRYHGIYRLKWKAS